MRSNSSVIKRNRFLALEELEPRIALSLPRPDHVVLVMMENHNYDEIIGVSSAPYINNTLAAQGALMTNSFAIEHPSEPNYLDIFSGSNQGVTDDTFPPPGSPYTTPDLGGELIKAGFTFGGYSEDMPSVGYTGDGPYGYAGKHNPMVDFADVPAADNMPYAGYFPTDFTKLPTFSFVVPNLIDDMHDGTVSQGDTWLKNNIEPYRQWAQTHNSLLIVTFDEDSSGNNQIATIFDGQMVKTGHYNEYLDHFGGLRTIEDMYGLPYAGASATATPVSDIFTQSSHLKVTSPASATAGSSFSITVTAQDANNNTLTSYLGTIHFTSSDGGAVLPSNYTFTTADAGVHTFTGVILKTAGNQTITATDTVNSSITGVTSLTVNPAAASTLVVAGFPSPTTAGTSHNFTVTARDAFGNTASGYTGTVAFTSSDGQAVLPANYKFTSTDAGKHTFSATLKTAGTQSLTATDTATSMITGSETGISVIQPTASSFSLSGFPSPTTAGTTGSVTVTALDNNGAKATGYNGTVHFTSSDGAAVLPSNYTFTSADAGMHTFSGMILKTAGSQTITATDTVTSSITGSQSVTVNPAAAKTLVVSGFPTSTTAGTPQNFNVTARDAYGNTATGYTGTVAFSSSDPKAVLPANYTFTSTDAGKHTFSATLNTIGTQSITATDTVTASITGTESGIVVTTAGTGATYYVSLTGSDNNPGTLSQPFATIKHGASVLKPGDTLYIRAGTYAEELVDAIPGGTSWSAPVTVAAYSGETVILRPTSSSAEGILFFADSSEQYIIVKGITIDATHASADAVKITWSSNAGASSRIRLQNDEIENTPNGMGVLITGDPSSGHNVDYNEFINCTIHNNGSNSLEHGFYITTNHNLVDGCNIYGNAGYGIQLYDGDGHNSLSVQSNIIRNNRVHDNSTAGGYSAGIVVATGDNNLLYDNLIYNNTRSLLGGIQLYPGVNATSVLNNTIYNNDDFGIEDQSGATNSVIENNIIYNNASGGINNQGSGAVIDHNTANGQNPLFVNAGVNDFHLQSVSPAIDAGITLAQLPLDFDGVSRPQGPAYDIGAYELVGNSGTSAVQASMTGPSSGVRGQPLTFSLGASEPGSGPDSVFSYSIQWGDGSPEQTITGATSTLVNHVFASGGSYAISVTVTDSSGASSNPASQSLAVTAVALQVDPTNSGQTALIVGGTTGDDTIVLSPANRHGAIKVVINGVNQGTFSPTGHILAYSQSGTDTIREIAQKINGKMTFINVPALIFGGAGNDTLDVSGSTAGNVLEGGAGNDSLVGGRGRDILIGGLGSDTLRAGSGGDILIGGTTSHDNNAAALAAILAEWTRTDIDYNTRIAHLSGSSSGGLNGTFFLNTSTVKSDSSANSLYGSAGMDWYFAGMLDMLFNQTTGEVVTQI